MDEMPGMNVCCFGVIRDITFEVNSDYNIKYSFKF